MKQPMNILSHVDKQQPQNHISLAPPEIHVDFLHKPKNKQETNCVIEREKEEETIKFSNVHNKYPACLFPRIQSKH